MGKLIDLKDSFLRSSEELFEEDGDEFFVWDGDALKQLPRGIPQLEDAPVVSINNKREKSQG